MTETAYEALQRDMAALPADIDKVRNVPEFIAVRDAMQSMGQTLIRASSTPTGLGEAGVDAISRDHTIIRLNLDMIYERDPAQAMIIERYAMAQLTCTVLELSIEIPQEMKLSLLEEWKKGYDALGERPAARNMAKHYIAALAEQNALQPSTDNGLAFRSELSEKLALLLHASHQHEPGQNTVPQEIAKLKDGLKNILTKHTTLTETEIESTCAQYIIESKPAMPSPAVPAAPFRAKVFSLQTGAQAMRA